MSCASETYMVKFGNAYAVQCFREARQLVDSALEDSPWVSELPRIKECLEEAWDGLSFSVKEE